MASKCAILSGSAKASLEVRIYTPAVLMQIEITFQAGKEFVLPNKRQGQSKIVRSAMSLDSHKPKDIPNLFRIIP